MKCYITNWVLEEKELQHREKHSYDILKIHKKKKKNNTENNTSLHSYIRECIKK